MTLGSFVMFNTYMAILVRPIGHDRARDEHHPARHGFPSADPGADGRAADDRAAGASTGLCAGSEARSEISNIAIRFPAGPALDGVSLRVAAGATVAIVGPTGSGKSTLANLIPRLMDPESGCVRIDGIDAREYSPSELRGQIGMVPQETFLFSATLADNLAFGVGEISDERMRWAAEIACLGSDIEGFPRGYQTLVGERGISLSGGQKQRTAIARAILRDPRILILDDALASVDTLTEEKILTGLRDVMRDRTTILISHRASTVRHADCIVVLSRNGRITQQGTHDELLKMGGYYAGFYQEQLIEAELEAV